MAQFKEKCSHCGTLVIGKRIRSNKNKKIRENVKEYAPIATTLAGKYVGGFIGSTVAKTLHSKYKKQIDRGIDMLGDMIEDTMLSMNYMFTCPHCGHTWVNDEIDSNGAMYEEGTYPDITNIYERDVIGYKYEYDYDESDPPEYLRIEQYRWLKVYCAIRHYCLFLVNSQPEGAFDYNKVINRIYEDIGYSIAIEQIKADTISEIYEELINLFYNQDDFEIDWFTLIETLPHGDNSDKYEMIVHNAVYVEGRVEAFGDTLIGVNISGTIEVGDWIVLSTSDNEYYYAQVVWIEMFDEKVDYAESGDTIGMGITCDLRDISGTILKVYKADEFDGNENEDDEDGLEFTSEEQEYINELKDILSNGEISVRERRLLEKIRSQLGISETRAVELETYLISSSLTSGEQEYIDEYREIISEGEISERDQRFLDKLKKVNGISDERAKILESMISDN